LKFSSGALTGTTGEKAEHGGQLAPDHGGCHIVDLPAVRLLGEVAKKAARLLMNYAEEHRTST